MFKELFTESKKITLPSVGKNLKIEKIEKEGTKSNMGRYPEKVNPLLVLSDDTNEYYFNTNSWWIIKKGQGTKDNRSYSDLSMKERKDIWALWGIKLR